MPRELFTEVVSPQLRPRTGSRYTMMLSVVAHVLIVAAVIIVPLMATGSMPSLPTGDLDYIMLEPAPAPPPLPTPPPPTATPTPAANPDAAPIDVPDEIRPEVPRPDVGEHVPGAIPQLGPSSRFGDGVGVGIGRDVAPLPPPVPAPPQKPLRPGGDIREPVKVKNVAPVYPQIAIKARIQGRVVIDAVIGTDGVVREARILSGVPLLNQAALDAVKQWRYTPTMLNNVPVQVIMTVTVQFNLQQ
jgi:protein TonB